MEPVSRRTRILLLGRLLNGIGGPFVGKFSVTGSIIATKAVTPISSGGTTGLLELLDAIALIRQECVSTKLVLVLIFIKTCKLPVLSNATLQ